MKKSIMLTMAVFAMILSCSQFASAQRVVCNNFPFRERNIYVTAPNFSVDEYVVVNSDGGYAEAGAYWPGAEDVEKIFCAFAGCSHSRNLGTISGGGLDVYIYCETRGQAYAKSEVWQW